uniref:Putative secreted peptide n=1 Tax=Anopheles braziliensis TaxID=58242 RepID=A0A2M3ZTG4_9DIPT
MTFHLSMVPAVSQRLLVLAVVVLRWLPDQPAPVEPVVAAAAAAAAALAAVHRCTTDYRWADGVADGTLRTWITFCGNFSSPWRTVRQAGYPCSSWATRATMRGAAKASIAS